MLTPTRPHKHARSPFPDQRHRKRRRLLFIHFVIIIIVTIMLLITMTALLFVHHDFKIFFNLVGFCYSALHGFIQTFGLSGDAPNGGKHPGKKSDEKQ